MKEFEVFGYAFVPVEIRMKVFADNESDAMRKAKALTVKTEEDSMHFEYSPKYQKLSKSIVSGSADESAAFGFEPLSAKPLDFSK